MTTEPAAGLSEDDYSRFRALVEKASGLDIPPARRLELEQALRQAQTRAGLPSAQALWAHLAQAGGRADLHALVEALTIGETHFFRNQPQFHALTHHVLPEIIERRRGARRLRLWSAGCATGEEAYSLAILVDRLLPAGEQWDVHLLATDINRQSLEKARRGLYSGWSFREVPPDLQASYFLRHQHGAETQFEVVPRLRHRIHWDYLNLIDAVYPAPETGTQALDLILFRNVLIYFSEATARAVVERMHACLTDGAWLVSAMPTPRRRSSPNLRCTIFPARCFIKNRCPSGSPHPCGQPP
jgi:chemotaxis protein methyltransferase CheR